MRLSSSIILLILALSAIDSNSCFGQKVKEYDSPEIKYYLRDTTLNFVINTDLPPSIIVSITVNRSFWKKGSTTEYSIEYFSKFGTVGEWEVVKEISLDDTKWLSDLSEQLKSLSRAGIATSVEKISDSIRLSVVVPYTNKPYPKFKKTGRSERKIFAPLKYSAGTVQEYGGPESLAVASSYSISRATPLMSELNPADPLASIAKTIDLPIRSVITILSVAKKDGRSWYEVSAKGQDGQMIGKGWVNSVALIGQEITLVK
jgi:hypothetical protein